MRKFLRGNKLLRKRKLADTIDAIRMTTLMRKSSVCSSDETSFNLSIGKSI